MRAFNIELLQENARPTKHNNNFNDFEIYLNFFLEKLIVIYQYVTVTSVPAAVSDRSHVWRLKNM